MIMEKQTTISGIYRDESGALINKDNTALKAYKAKKEQSRKLIDLEKKMDTIDSDICSIKEMLLKLLNKQG